MSSTDSGRGDPSLSEGSQEPVTDSAWGENHPISERRRAVSTGGEEEGYKNSGEVEDRGDSRDEDRSEESDGDPGGGQSEDDDSTVQPECDDDSTVQPESEDDSTVQPDYDDDLTVQTD